MVTVVKKEYRKPYILSEGGYQEMMRSTSDKSVWNDILDVDPAWAEFLFTRSELPDAATAAEIRYLRYIKQSEFKKMYSGRDYVEEEYLFGGPIGGIDIDPFDFGWDFPWMPTEGGGVYPGPGEGPGFSTFICDAETDGCYCPGIEKDVTITATYPIIGVDFVFGEGETITAVSPSWGLNSVTITISTPSTRSGQMRLRVWMQLPSGASCDSEINIYECPEDECCGDCEMEWDWDNSDETIVAPGSGNVYVTGGTPPYTWSLTDEDGKWSLLSSQTATGANTVSAAAGACGSATITVTDSCNCTATGSVRNPSNGSWTVVCGFPLEAATVNCCVLPGVSGSYVSNIGSSFKYQAIQGKYRQTEWWQLQGAKVTWPSESDCNSNIDIMSSSYIGGWGTPVGGNLKSTCQYVNYTPCMALPTTTTGYAGCPPIVQVEGSNYYRTNCYGVNICYNCFRSCISLPCTGYTGEEWTC